MTNATAPATREVFISDIHGEFATFARLLDEDFAQGARVHVVGDIYDRGPAPDKVMDLMATRVGLDIQWGNHDILWMGAAAGQIGCICNVVRICARYGNLDVLEEVYGIDLGPLRSFANEAYANDPCAAFDLKGSPDLSPDELAATVRVQKAMAIIQFKVEAQLIAENPGFGLEERNLLGRVDFTVGTIELDGVTHELLDAVFPTVDPADPYALTPGEAAVADALVAAFTSCARLQDHMRVFLERGSLYRAEPDANTLLFHACVPMKADGTFLPAPIFGRELSGRALFDAVDGYVRDAFLATDPAAKKRGLDLIWYLWLGAASPLFAKSKMATFELYYLADKAARKEEKNPFYALLADDALAAAIFEEFGLQPAGGRIVCGHVPVKVKDDEDPVKCGGRLIDIDGGMSRPYQASTGIGGMVLVHEGASWRLGNIAPWQEQPAEGPLAITWREV